MKELKGIIEFLRSEITKIKKELSLMDSNPFDKDVWNTDDLKFITGKSKASIYLLTAKKEIPHYKKGHSCSAFTIHTSL